MPTRRYRRRIRRFKPKRKVSTFRKYASNAVWAAKQIWKLKGLVNSEMLKLDTSASNDNVTDSGSVYHLTAVPQGDTSVSRTGNSIFVRSSNLKGFVVRGSSGDVAIEFNVSLVMDTQQVSDTLPSVTDIYASASPHAHLNGNTVGKYKILYSKKYILTNANNNTYNIDFNLPMRHHVRYNGTGSGDIQKGGLYLIFRSSQATSNYPAVSFEHRLSYHDN